ncbi:MAG: hypothetical protein ABFD92_10240 [Planctomycetaceae bacterium]|nr:hypothetical protein [Planctomycetaceae bacterium]
MPESTDNEAAAPAPQLPPPAVIRRAVDIYLTHAYNGSAPAAVADLVPPAEFDPPQWLSRSVVEPVPVNAPLEQVRSFALRLGNSQYPHMKLRISRTPNEGGYLFSVDCHDAFLRAPQGSPDYEALESLKRHNAALASAITAEWDSAGLPTERNYLRRKIREVRQREE